MKIMSQAFMNFKTREEYLSAVSDWKYNMRVIVNAIKKNNSEIYSLSQLIDKKIHQEYHHHFFVEDVISRGNSQRNKLLLANVATNLLKLRKKMKKLAGRQRQQRLLEESQTVNKELVTV